MAERLGKYTIILNSHPSVTGFAAVVGKTEGEGPLKDEFDFVFEDDTLGEASFEKAESALQKEAVTRALSKAGKTPDEVDFSLAGDLLNQCIGSSFGLRSLNMPFIGLYGACSTMALSLGLARCLLTAARQGSQLRRHRATSARRNVSSGFRSNTADSAHPPRSAPPRRQGQA